jgi:addiction module RelE/StbE family toxin
MNISFSSSFKKAFKKQISGRKQIEKEFWDIIEIFIENPFNHKLKTHKLQGKLNELWSFSVEYDLRIIFYFVENDTKAVFVDIGKHDEVY